MESGISGKTRVCGIFGYPLEHTFSPVIHNAAFNELGLNYIYVPFPVKPGNLRVAVEAVRAFELAGVNVTIPHKEAVIPFLDELSQEAGIIGAVNTIVNREGKLRGENTDGLGFIRSLQEKTGFDPAGREALILGAGGAARAVAIQLALAGAGKLLLANRSPRRAEELAFLISLKTEVSTTVVPWPDKSGKVLPGDILNGVDLVVQTTPVGMYPNHMETVPFPFDKLKPGQIVCDLVYNPVETQFLKNAGVSGAFTVDGLGMLLHQGALAFEMWTGVAAPVEVMRKALVRTVLEKDSD